MLKDKLTKKVLGFFVTVVLVEVFLLNFFASIRLSEYSEQKASDRLQSNAILMREGFDAQKILSGDKEIQTNLVNAAKKIGLRLTVVNVEGKVLVDSAQNIFNMENHRDRPEIKKALSGRIGDSTRVSDTLKKSMKYVAIPLYDNEIMVGVLRVAIPLSFVETETRLLHQVVLFGGLVAAALAFVVGFFVSKKITKPILEMQEAAKGFAQGDFSHELKSHREDELGELAGSLDHMAKELQDQIKDLKEMDKIKTEFVANVSHELKTPLTSIKGFVETLEDGAIEDKDNARRFLSIISKHTDRLSKIVDDLLTLSSLEKGEEALKLENETFDFVELIEEVLMSFSRTLALKNQQFKINKEDGVYDIYADRMRIEEVLVNLIDNASKYTPEKGEITFELSADTKKMFFSIADNGIGISKEHQERIFERFYRADKARSRDVGGTGLGLSIVKHIVNAHKGTINLESNQDKGTRINVMLPKQRI